MHSYRHRYGLVAGAGHNLPQEVPQIFAQAVLDLVRF
jgi:pimeloyl-ACP methyl ester carboxylesterase